MFRTIAKGCAWIVTIALTLLVLVVAVFGDWQAAARLGVFGYFLLAIVHSLITAIQRRRNLARRMAAPPAAPPVVPPPAYCYTMTRGDGELRLDEHGSLHFLACPKVSWLIRNTSRGLRQRSQAERSLAIPRNQLRVAVPFERLSSGPSVVVGYGPQGNGLSWEEFILATIPTATSFPQPTGDPGTWAWAIAPGETPPDLQQEAARYRKRIRRRSVRIQWTVCTLLYTAICVAFFVILVLAVPGHFLVPLAIAGGMWVALMLFTGTLIVLCNR
jgi:hypothetical protein